MGALFVPIEHIFNLKFCSWEIMNKLSKKIHSVKTLKTYLYYDKLSKSDNPF